MKRKSSIAALLFAAVLAIPAAGGVYIRVAPPRPVAERVVVAPARGYVYAGGYYRWTGRSYVWVGGRWVLPPRPRAVWVPPHWDYVPTRSAYIFVPGVWR